MPLQVISTLGALNRTLDADLSLALENGHTVRHKPSLLPIVVGHIQAADQTQDQQDVLLKALDVVGGSDSESEHKLGHIHEA